jgi:ribosomal protein S24E
MGMYNMIESLAYDVYCVDAYLQFAIDNKSKKLISKLDALKETMVITSGDNYVGASEPQLREKMTNLFQRVESNPGAPTTNELESWLQIKKGYNTTREELSKIEKKYKLGKRLTLKTKEQFLKK